MTSGSIRKSGRSWHVAAGTMILLHIPMSLAISATAVLLSDSGPVAGMFGMPSVAVEAVTSGIDSTKATGSQPRADRETERSSVALTVSTWSLIGAGVAALVGGLSILIRGVRRSNVFLMVVAVCFWVLSAIAGWMWGFPLPMAISLLIVPALVVVCLTSGGLDPVTREARVASS